MQEKLTQYIQMTEKALEEYLTEDPCLEGVIYQSMHYSVFAGGKRLRPAMVLAACELFGGDVQEALPFACAMEMIHTASLIHDDLPAMDNDDLRRGKPTNHIRFGEDMAILAGDGLINKAYETMADALVAKTTPQRAKALQIIADQAGTHGMIGGQVVDILSEGKALDSMVLGYIHNKKTGALIRASLLSGAVLADASEDAIADLTAFADNLGLAFQVRDDLLDYVGDAAVMGKNTQSDAALDKTTFATLYGIEGAQVLVREYTDTALEHLKKLPGDTSFLAWLAETLVGRQK